jgi:hypothetical protein
MVSASFVSCWTHLGRKGCVKLAFESVCRHLLFKPKKAEFPVPAYLSGQNCFWVIISYTAKDAVLHCPDFLFILPGVHSGLERCWSNGFGRVDQDQERDRPDTDIPPIVQRRNLRLLRHEHRRRQLSCVHQVPLSSEQPRNLKTECFFSMFLID